MKSSGMVVCWALVTLLGLPTSVQAVEAGRGETSAASQASAEHASTGQAPVEPLTVTVAGSRSLRKDVTADETTVSGERLRQSARATTFDAISQEAGDVYVSGRANGIDGVSNGATGAMHVRGLGGSPNTQVLIVEDGVPEYQGIFGHPLPDEFFPTLIDRAAVVKGGDSVLYGTNAMGGALILGSRFRQAEGYEVESDTAAGSYATLRERASLLGRWGTWDAALAAQAFKTDGHRDGAGGDDLVVQGSARYRVSNGLQLGIANKVMHVTGGDPGPVTHPYTDHTFDVWRDKVSLRAVYETERLRLHAVPYVNYGLHRLYDGFHSRDVTGGAIAEATYKLAPSAELLVGVASEGVTGSVENRITNELTPVKGSSTHALYHQITVRPVGPLAVVFGVRDVYSTRYGASVLYKAGARLSLGHGVFLHTRVVRNFRQPTLRELYLPYPTANPDLKPEYALNADCGAGYISRHWQVEGSVYRTQATNLIKYFGVWPAAEVVNIDRIIVWGLAGRVALRDVGPFTLSVTGDWQDVGRYTRQNPSAKVNFALEALEPLGPGDLGATLCGEWVHGLFMGDYGRQPIDDVFVVDLAIRFRHVSPAGGATLEPYLLLRNLFDRSYAYVADYVMPGFNVLSGLRMQM